MTEPTGHIKLVGLCKELGFLVQAKFKPPYLPIDQRRGLDARMTEIISEIKEIQDAI